jgi:spore coat protein U-like protein
LINLHALLAVASLFVGSSSLQPPVRGPIGPHNLHPHATTCSFGSLAMAFGAYAPLGTNSVAPLEATGSVKVTCSFLGNFTLTANNGANSADATATCATAVCSRAMLAGVASFVSYDLYTTSAYTTVWNSSNGIAGTGIGLLQTVSIFGYVPPGIASAAGSYTDTVTVTVTF